MKLKEAYSILEIPSTATPEEAKKRYRELAKKLHPDINKEPDAEAKFKKINEAYQIIESGEETEPATNGWSSWGGTSRPDPFGDPFSVFRSTKRQYYSGKIDLDTNISFKESVQGVKKEIKYSRQIKCPHCQGSGDKPVNNGCKKCGGRGQTTMRQSGAIYVQTCPDCMGRAKTTSCTNCESKGVLDTNASMTVSIPPAVFDGNVLRLGGMGNYSGTLLGIQDQYTDVYVHIHVEKDKDMWLEGKDIVSTITIPLLDALRGCTCKIRSLDGEKEITIDPRTNNKNEVHLSVGDHSNIKHRIVVNVKYPDVINNLIDVLQKEST